jgi:hypothetical protein
MAGSMDDVAYKKNDIYMEHGFPFKGFPGRYGLDKELHMH